MYSQKYLEEAEALSGAIGGLRRLRFAQMAYESSPSAEERPVTERESSARRAAWRATDNALRALLAFQRIHKEESRHGNGKETEKAVAEGQGLDSGAN